MARADAEGGDGEEVSLSERDNALVAFWHPARIGAVISSGHLFYGYISIEGAQPSTEKIHHT